HAHVLSGLSRPHSRLSRRRPEARGLRGLSSRRGMLGQTFVAHGPLAQSRYHTRRLPSQAPVTATLPSALSARQRMPRRWSQRFNSLPVRASHRQSVPSSHEESALSPSGRKATPVMPRKPHQPVCPSKRQISSPERTL